MRARAALLALVLVAAGCGGDDPAPPAPAKARSERLVDFSKKPPFVNTLDIDPRQRRLPADHQPRLLADRRRTAARSPRSRARSPPRARPPRSARSSRSAPPGRASCSAAATPTTQGKLPNFLGLLRSDDGGKTWSAVSRLGDADLHKIVLRHDRLYAFDADPLRDADLERRRQDLHGGVHAARADDRLRGRPGRPRAHHRLDRDRAVPHRGRRALVAAADQRAKGIRLAWPEPDALYRADADGTIKRLRGRRHALARRRRVGGEPYELHATGPKALFLVLSDGSILETHGRRRHVARSLPALIAAAAALLVAAPAASAHSLVRVGGGEAAYLSVGRGLAQHAHGPRRGERIEFRDPTVDERRSTSAPCEPGEIGDDAQPDPGLLPRRRRRRACGSTSATARTPRRSTLGAARRRCSAATARTR